MRIQIWLRGARKILMDGQLPVKAALSPRTFDVLLQVTQDRHSAGFSWHSTRRSARLRRHLAEKKSSSDPYIRVRNTAVRADFKDQDAGDKTHGMPDLDYPGSRQVHRLK